MVKKALKRPADSGSIPENKVGIGLRVPYIKDAIENHHKLSKKIGWFEIHSENYYAKGGPAIDILKKVRNNFPLSFHSVGNSLGSSAGLDLNHLKRLKSLVEMIDPFLISDHISWGYINKQHLNDLLPLPYTKEALKIICANISKMQDVLKRQILIENPSAYLAFKNPEMTEFDFINQACKITGCALLLDVNNIFVSEQNNHEFSAQNYLNKIDKKIVKEIHLAGHSSSEIFDGKQYQEILIDTHNDIVRKEVWDLYKIAIKNFGKVPSLIEWDQDFPKLEVLLDEAKKATKILQDVTK